MKYHFGPNPPFKDRIRPFKNMKEINFVGKQKLNSLLARHICQDQILVSLAICLPDKLQF